MFCLHKTKISLFEDKVGLFYAKKTEFRIPEDDNISAKYEYYIFFC